MMPAWIAWLLVAAASWLLRGTLLTLFLALLLSYLLRAPVEALSRRTSRGMAAGVVLLGFLGLACGTIAALFPTILEQGGQFLQALPGLAGSLVQHLKALKTGLMTWLPESWNAQVEMGWASLAAAATEAARQAGMGALRGLREVLTLAIVPVLTYYLLRDGPRMGSWILAWVPGGERGRWEQVLRESDHALAGYVRGQGTVCLLQALIMTALWSLIGLPYALVLGPLAGLAELAPFLGAATINLLVLSIGLAHGGWTWAWALGLYFGSNQVLGNFIAPRVLSEHVEVHPLVVLLALAAGAELAGPTGVLLALPAAALLKAVLLGLREESREA